MTKGGIVLIVVAIIVIAGFIYFYNKNKNDPSTSDTPKTCFDLPSTSDTTVFGPKYWAAFHQIASQIPCSKCSGFAQKAMVYMHDLVNKKIGKPIFDPANYNYFNQSISNLNTGMDFNTAFNLPTK